MPQKACVRKLSVEYVLQRQPTQNHTRIDLSFGLPLGELSWHKQARGLANMNSRVHEILIALSWHLRVLSVEQIARAWWAGAATARRLAHDVVTARVQSGWLDVREVISRPTTPLDGPVVTWEPGMRTPDFNELSRLLQRRARTSARKLKVVIATRKCRQLLGVPGGAHRPKLTQLSHELFVGEVFIHYRDSGMDMDEQWVGEDQLPRPWPIRLRPDALIQDQDGEIIRAVEYGGAYTARRVSALHGAFKGISLPYEIW